MANPSTDVAAELPANRLFATSLPRDAFPV